MDIQPILNAVDIAIATAADKEFKRLRRETLKTGSHVDVVESVADSLESLAKLANSDDMPDYDNEWVALFYPAWYQPKQINIVCSVLQALRDNGAATGGVKWRDGDIFGVGDGRAHFIDFGCGSLAMQFAVAITAADSISRGRALREIRIDSYDPHPQMIRVGQNIWREFVRRMKIHHPRHPICKVFDLIQWETHAKLDALPKAMDAPRFLSAIHAVYKDTKDEVKTALESLVAKYDPVGFLFTTQANSTNWDILRSASPIREGDTYGKIPVPSPKARFDGELDALTEWRKSLCASLLDERKLQSPAGINIGIIKGFLDNDVEWWYPNPAVLLYTRKDLSEFTG